MKQIPLTQGKVALVGDADYNWLNQWNWSAHKDHKTFYAMRNIIMSSRSESRRTGQRRMISVLMHRVILGLQPGDEMQCDHRDGNGLNNRRSNLRFCTAMQNGQSRRNQKMGTSRYKGVCWHRGEGKWYSQIGVNKKRIYVGSFDSEVAAAQAYDAAALKYHRNFALTNEMLGLL